MNKKQITKVVKKNVKKVAVKAKSASADLEKLAMKEYGKIKKQMDTTAKKVEGYVKKNPEKAAAISAGIGMALGAIAGILAGSKMKGKKKKK
ncbi:MAG: hypothetical protein ACD_8C00033G0001 [uncultured bacterium]|nr:MAG: hypothetical protein ACD_8C00033G0001 [uncultured bacterium]